MTSMVPILSRALKVYKNKQYIYFKNSLIIINFIHKEKNKRNLCSMSVFLSDKDTTKLYIQFFRLK